jgi:poly-beta-1,6-N-acetyl-D-glucosamine synthase
MSNGNYILITAARNEEIFIEATIKAVLSQTVLPKMWIIISDGSTDRTDEIISKYSAQHDFIKFVRRETKNCVVNFSSKVHAIYEGINQSKKIEHDYIGILDGDVTFSPFYYERVLIKFKENEKLGLAGGVVFDKHDERCVRRSPAYIEYVSGCVQLFRRKCYEDIGGLVPLKDGGEDTVAVIMARMKGWRVESFDELIVFHHKQGNAARGALSESYRSGRLFYALGSHPLFEILKSINRIRCKPFVIYAVTRMCGYLWPCFQRQERPVSDEFVKFMRTEQWTKLKTVFLKEWSTK